MYDKTVRRRRLVLAALVVTSLLLLTAYFGEANGGPLHLFQRGVIAVVSPVEEGLSRAFKPVRDTFGWIGDTVDAKGDLKQARKDADKYRRDAIANEGATRENAQLKGMLDIQNDNAKNDPVNARVIGNSPTLWYTDITIDKGSRAGIAVDMPVLGIDGRTQASGLVGVVTIVTPNSAKVTLITDHSVSVAGRLAIGNTNRADTVNGVLQGSVGDPSVLEMQYVAANDKIIPGDSIVTAGTTSKRDEVESLFPPNIPIGRVSGIDEPGTDSQVVRVRPFINMKRVEFVQVLTTRVDGNRK